jgi:mono/diheme cytochrome c family protein
MRPDLCGYNLSSLLGPSPTVLWGVLSKLFMLTVHLACRPYYSAVAIQALFVFSSSLLTGAPANKVVDFQREIRPLFAENCFQCHGPDSTTRMAGLRLDLKDAVFEARKSGQAIVPSRPDESLVYQRIASTNKARLMPPVSSHRSLNPQQIATIKLWIEQGAIWREHWALKAPVKAALPAVRNAAWIRNPIDRFVLAKLEAAGLDPAPQADRRTLIRRVALDMTGLPPSPADLERFTNDLKPGAYERMVDRYLASPHYGEHRARYWLDAARYGDTHGIHVDNYREIWPYRDWVINAFNRNQPFDQFSIEQLAGDLLPNATLAQKIATGFHRCNVTTNEAGLIEDEYAEIYAKDRADTTAAVWLGLTVGCATCHDHKFDPILQKDFYALGAFFRNTTQNVMDDNIPDTPPVLVVPRPEDQYRWEKVSARRAQVRAEMARMESRDHAAFRKWLSEHVAKHVELPLDEADQMYGLDLAALRASPEKLPENQFRIGDSDVAGRPAMHFLTTDGWKAQDVSRLDSEKPFSISVSFLFPKTEQAYVIASHRNPKDKNRGWSLEVAARVAVLRIVGDGGKNIEVRAAHLAQLTHGSWNSLTVTYDGSRHQAGLAMYLNGRAIPTQGGGNQNVELQGEIGVDNPLLLGPTLPDGAISEFHIFNRVLSESEARLLHEWPRIAMAIGRNSADLTEADQDAMRTWFLVKEDKEFRKLIREQDEVNEEAKSIARRGAVTLVMQEKLNSKPSAHLLYRGAYDQKRAQVTADTPTALPPMRSDLPKNRLGFAKWLFTEEHPLTARVTVNRMWQEIFGTGIVKTADDFGSQGEPPANPELLDWLAVDFRESGWDVKKFYRQLLLSAAYRQRAQLTL